MDLTCTLILVFLLTGTPDVSPAGEPGKGPINWGTASLSAENLLDGIGAMHLTDSDFFFDGGSLVYEARSTDDRKLYIGLPHPAAVLDKPREVARQFILISDDEHFKSYAIVEVGSKAEKQLISLLQKFIERSENLKEKPKAWHGQDLVQAAKRIVTIVRTRKPPRIWGSKALGMMK